MTFDVPEVKSLGTTALDDDERQSLVASLVVALTPDTLSEVASMLTAMLEGELCQCGHTMIAHGNGVGCEGFASVGMHFDPEMGPTHVPRRCRCDVWRPYDSAKPWQEISNAGQPRDVGKKQRKPPRRKVSFLA